MNGKIKAKELKKQARKNLKGHWGQGIGVTLVYGIISIILNLGISFSIGKNFKVLGIIIIYPLIFGMVYYYLNLSRKKQKFMDLFEMFKSRMWLNSLKIIITFMVGLIITSLLFTISIVMFKFIEARSFPMTLYTSMEIKIGMMILSMIWFLCAAGVLLLPAIIFACTYSQIIFLKLDNKEASVREIFKSSRLIMRGNKWRLIRFQLSYIGWGILSIITFGIGLIWLCPYKFAGSIEFYNSVVQNRSVKEVLN